MYTSKRKVLKAESCLCVNVHTLSLQNGEEGVFAEFHISNLFHSLLSLFLFSQ